MAIPYECQYAVERWLVNEIEMLPKQARKFTRKARLNYRYCHGCRGYEGCQPYVASERSISTDGCLRVFMAIISFGISEFFRLLITSNDKICFCFNSYSSDYWELEVF